MFTHSRLKHNWRQKWFSPLYSPSWLPTFAHYLYFLEIFQNFDAFKEYFSETFRFFHVLKRIFLGKFSELVSCLQKLSISFMFSKEKFSENFRNFERIFLGNFLVQTCFEKKKSQKFSGTLYEYFFYFWKKTTLFLSCRTRLFQDCKEYFYDDFPVLSCLRKKISLKISWTFMFSKNFSRKLSGSFMSWKECF